MIFTKLLLNVLPIVPWIGLGWISSAWAQSITPANDGTGSRVTQSGDRYDIRGGSLSNDGRNLFHNFEQFGLSASEIANFISTPQIQNILGRVSGGDASMINGLLQVTGGNSNLYLINPAGILFGANARLDLPASFTATTATGIGFGNTWLNATGTSDYSNLVGTPTGFAFATDRPGTIVNAGNLAVTAEQSLMLLGGTVINTGTLTAPGGTITIAAIPGQNQVRISQEGQLLSLDLEAITPFNQEISTVTPLPFTPLSLPELLTGGDIAQATGLTVNADGTVRLTSSNTTIPTTPGTTIVSGTINTSNPTPDSPLPIPHITLLGDRVALLSATLNASSTDGGGTIRIGGDYQGQGTVFNASRTVVDANSIITADALNTGDGGRVIVWADDTTAFSGTVTARGGRVAGNGGFVEVSGRDNLIFRGNADLSATNGAIGTLLLDPLNIRIVNGSGAADDPQVADGQLLFAEAPGATFTISETALEGLTANASVTLEATNDIILEDLGDNELRLPTAAGAGVTLFADRDRDGSGTIEMLDPNDTISTQGGRLVLSGATLRLGGVSVNNAPNTGSNLVLEGDEIDLLGGTGSVRLGTNGTFEFPLEQIDVHPRTSGQAIAIGGTGDRGPQTLDLTETDFAALNPNEGDLLIWSGGDIVNPAAGDITIVPGATPLQRIASLVTGGTLRIDRELVLDIGFTVTATEIDIVQPITIRGILNGVPYPPSSVILSPNPGQNVVVGGTADTGLNTLDLTATDLANLTSPTGYFVLVIGNQDPDFSAGDITIAPGATPLTFANRRVNLDTFAGTVRIQRELNFNQPSYLGIPSILTVTAADVELDALVTAQNATFRPADPTSTIGLGDRTDGIFDPAIDGAFNLNTTELTNNLNVSGTVEIGSPGLTGTGTVFLRNLAALRNENYSLTIRGGDIRFVRNVGLDGTPNADSDPIIELADNRTAQFISTSTIFEGNNMDVVLGNNGAVLFDAANGIEPRLPAAPGNPGNGFDFFVRNNGTGTFAARVRNSGIIHFDSGGNLIVGSVGGVNGISVAGDGSIDFSGTTLTINQPVTVGGSGAIQIGSPGSMTLNSSIRSGSGNITLTSGQDRPGFPGINFRPITIDSGGGEITTNGGNIVITGGLAGNQPLNLNAGAGSIAINPVVDDQGVPPPINTVPLSRLTVNTGSTFTLSNPVAVAGDVSITAADIQLDALLDAGAGNITFQPADPTSTIGLGNGAVGAFNLTTTELTTNLNSSGTLTIGSPGFTSTGEVVLQNLSSMVAENYDLTVRGGDIRFAGQGAIVQLAPDSIARFISSGNISMDSDQTAVIIGIDGSDLNTAIDPNNGIVLFDAATGIGQTGFLGGVGIDVPNVAARTRTSGGIQLGSSSNLPRRTVSIDGVDGISTAPDGDIVFRARLITVDRPISANGSGNITIQSAGGMTLLSPISSGSGDITFNTATGFVGVFPAAPRPVTLAGNGGQITTNGGNITFNSGIDGDRPLILNAGVGNIQINPAINPNVVPGINNTPLNSLTVNTSGNFTLTNPVAVAGDVSINATDVSLNTLLNASSGRVTIRANNNVTTSDITAASGISIRSIGGNIDTSAGTLNTASDSGSGGAIALSAPNGSIRTGNLNSFGIRGGAVSVRAETAIRTGAINTSGTQGNGGNVVLDPIRDIQVESINAQGGVNGRGGIVSIATGRFFRAVGTFVDRNGALASISTAGGLGGGSITIEHGGGLRNTPFIVGNATVNGTAGRITSGEFAIAPVRLFPGSFTRGNIQIITETPLIPTTPTPPTVTLPVRPPENEPEPLRNPASARPPSINNPSILDPGIEAIDDRFTREFEEHLNPPATPPDAQDINPPQVIGSVPNPEIPQPPDVSVVPSSPEGDNAPSPQLPEASGITPPSSSEASSPDDSNLQEQPENTSPEGGDTPISQPPGTLPGEGDRGGGTPNNLEEPPGTHRDISGTGANPSNNGNIAPESGDTGRSPSSLAEMRAQLRRIEEATGIKPALIYGVFVPSGFDSTAAATSEPDKNQESDLIWQFNAQGLNVPMTISQALEQARRSPQDDDYLQLFVVTAEGDVIVRPMYEVTRSRLLVEANEFRDQVTDKTRLQSPRFLPSSQQLYQWLVAPLEQELQAQEIDNLVFLMDDGLRSLPLAALHDGQGFLVERYSIGLMPSLNLTDTRYLNINNAQVLAMGASQFSTLDPLPAAAVETATIAQTLWRGQVFLNEAFTLQNLELQRQQRPFGIIHLATHAAFQPGPIGNSYIQLWGNEQLRLNQIRELGWNEPPVELVVLSACRTALGDEEAELGFAGFAVQAGVKSALASLWSVDDIGTLGLMTEFYQQLQTAPIKAEALRQAQLAMIRQQIRIENSQLIWSNGTVSLPPELQRQENEEINLSHPYYWSGFTMIGSPW